MRRIIGGRAADVEGVSAVVVVIFEGSDDVRDVCGGGEVAGRLRLVFNSGGDIALEGEAAAFSPDTGDVGD